MITAPSLSKQNLLLALILIASVFAAYSNTYNNSFLYDDEFLIQKNEIIRTWHGLTTSFLTSSTGGAGGHDSFYRPMQSVLYTLVYQAAGASTVAFHLLNILLHALNAVLIFYLGRRLGFSRIGAWFAALLWCVHPIHTEAVTYQSATADPLYGFFLLAALLVWAPDFDWRRVPAVIGLYVLGLLSKETAIVLPALAVAALFLIKDGRWHWRTYLVTLPLWLVAGLYLLVRKTILNFDDTFHFYKTANVYTEHILYRLYTFFATLPSYFGLLLWPSHLHMDRQFPVFTQPGSAWVLFGGFLLLAGLSALWLERNRARPLVSFAVLWFIAAQVPQSGVLLPVNAMFLEHWMYVPSIGAFLVVGETVVNWRWMQAVVLAATGALAMATFRQNEIWQTPITFYSNIIKYEGRIARVHNNLAMAYDDIGDDDKAIAEYRTAIAISDTYPQSHHNLALALIRKGQLEEAIQHLQRALQIDPDFYYSSGILAQIYHQQGDTARADEYSKRYVESLQKFRPPK